MTSLRLRRALPRAEVRRVVVLDIDGLHTSHPVRRVRRGLAAAGIYSRRRGGRSGQGQLCSMPVQHSAAGR